MGMGGHLPAVSDAATQTQLETLMRQEGVPEVWTGGREQETPLWFWVPGQLFSY